MNKWKKTRLGDVILTNTSSYSSKEGWEFVNYLDTGNITKNIVDKIQRIDLNTEKLPSRAKRKVKYNSILYSTVRPNQHHYGIIKEHLENFLVSTGFTVIDVDEVEVDADFLYYLLSQDRIIERLHSIAEQSVSAYPSIKSADIENIEVELPPLTEQKKIASVLCALSSRIQKNTEINNNLEQQAQAIFDNMFPNTSSGDKFIGDFITPKRGKNLLSKNAILGDVPVVAGGLEPSTYHNVSNTQAPVLAISASGANAGYVSLWNTPIWSSDSSYIDSSMTNDVYFWYVLLKKRQTEIFDTQTGSAQPHIYPQHIATMPITNISNDDISTFTNTVTPIFERIGHNKAENIRLSALRDTLLPKLMSGELDVSDIDL